MSRLIADPGLSADAKAVGALLLHHAAAYPTQGLPSQHQVGQALGILPSAMALAAYDLSRRGYLD
ncbi:hypothetical protein OKC48_11245 [Methylorubrum extorquens]|uniref:hypothetical protein n=1 Tax=Methylorubrum extorquens TaxID=408 RepID=UPI0022378374|nr:hypothetical protein [Methylorubrum extorquens]UYW29045.1 hypothetical protein OKC48_11245 [Methylorubrum extorquens]